MNNIRNLALAAVMAMTAMPGMAQETAKKVCVINGDLNGWPANLVTIVRLGEDDRYYGDTIPIRDGHFCYELDADGSTAYCITALRDGIGKYANFFAENGTVSITFHPDSVADVRSDTPLNKEMRRVMAATDTITDEAFGRLEALKRAKRDYTEPARRLMELRETTRNSDSLKAIDTKLRRLQADGRLLTSEFVAANNAVGEAFRRMFKARCDYAVEHPGLVGLYFLHDAVNSGFADTALVGKAVTEIYAPRYPAAYSTRWLQGWLAGCNTKVGGGYFDFTAPDLDGNDHTLSEEIAGRVALIDLWGSWCASCRKHSKELIPVYNKYKDRGFTVVGVAREYDNAGAMKTAIKRDGYPWLNLLELDDRLGIWKRYGIGNAGGGRFLIDRNGKILAINPDAAQVEAILKDKL